jgi:opacity protein-like surface antigen
MKNTRGIGMKKVFTVGLFSASLVCGTTAFAGVFSEEIPIASSISFSDSGFYLGLEGGYGDTNWRNLDGTSGVLSISGPGTQTTVLSAGKDSDFIGRICAGYDFNRYYAAEIGYSYYFDKAKIVDAANNDNYTSFKTQNLDMFLKGKIPAVDDLSLFAKVGADYLFGNVSNYGTFVTSATRGLCLAYGAGIDYVVSSNIVTSIEWLRNSGKQKVSSKSYTPQSDSIMIGIRYKFDSYN